MTIEEILDFQAETMKQSQTYASYFKYDAIHAKARRTSIT